MLFSVVIPVFNSSLYVANALDSIRSASTSKDYEIIVIDDLSLDIAPLKKILQYYPEVSLVEKQVKTNAADSRNIGLLASKGDIVFFLDSDDYFLEGAIDRRIKIHYEQCAGIIFGNYISAINGLYIPSNLSGFCENIDMRDYILDFHGDFRSSTVSIIKKKWKGTLFDPASFKHQDWIYGIKCYDDKENIFFDERYSVILNGNNSGRMSFSTNISASNYFVRKFLKKQCHINKFSKINWLITIRNRDVRSCNFFFSLYREESLLDLFCFFMYKASSFGPMICLSSIIIKYHVMMCHAKREMICFVVHRFRSVFPK